MNNSANNSNNVRITMNNCQQKLKKGNKFLKCSNRRVVFKKKITQNEPMQYCSTLGPKEFLKTFKFKVQIPSTNEEIETDLAELNLHEVDNNYTIQDLKQALLFGDLENVRTYYYMIALDHTNILEDQMRLRSLKFDSSIIIRFIDNNVCWRRHYENQFGRVEFIGSPHYKGLIELSQDHLLYDPEIKKHIHQVTIYNFGSSQDLQSRKYEEREFERNVFQWALN